MPEVSVTCVKLCRKCGATISKEKQKMDKATFTEALSVSPNNYWTSTVGTKTQRFWSDETSTCRIC